MPKVSIVMPTHNKKEYLDLTLASFSVQNYKDFEIIIIDDGSDVSNLEIIEKYRNKININYQYYDKGGRAFARNKALEIVQGKYAIFNDDDRIPARDFIEEHLRKLEENPDVITIGAKHEILTYYSEEINIDHLSLLKMCKKDPSKLDKLLDQSGAPLISSNDLIENFDDTINEWYIQGTIDGYTDIYDRYTDKLIDFYLGWGIATTGNMGICLDKFSNIRFDEKYKGWGVEDTDYAYQLFLQGGTFQYARNAISFHQIHATSSNKWAECNRNLSYFCNKYKTIEVYAFVQAFEWGNFEFNIEDANELLKRIKEDPENPFVVDFVRLCRLLGKNFLG